MKPRVKDLTGELGKLRPRRVMPAGVAPTPPANLERRPAFNWLGATLWIGIALFLLLQAAFFVWLLR